MPCTFEKVFMIRQNLPERWFRIDAFRQIMRILPLALSIRFVFATLVLPKYQAYCSNITCTKIGASTWKALEVPPAPNNIANYNPLSPVFRVPVGNSVLFGHLPHKVPRIWLQPTCPDGGIFSHCHPYENFNGWRYRNWRTCNWWPFNLWPSIEYYDSVDLKSTLWFPSL